jgi:hypothetical protein
LATTTERHIDTRDGTPQAVIDGADASAAAVGWRRLRPPRPNGTAEDDEEEEDELRSAGGAGAAAPAAAPGAAADGDDGWSMAFFQQIIPKLLQRRLFTFCVLSKEILGGKRRSTSA